MTQQEAEVILKVNDQQARDKFEQLKKEAADLRTKFAEAFKKGDTREIDRIGKELKKVDRQMNNMRTNAANIRAALKSMDQATPRELQRTIKLINNEINSGRVKRGSEEWDFYIGKLKEAQAELKKVKEEMKPDNDKSILDKIKNGINGWGTTAAAAMVAFSAVVTSGKAAVKAYAEMEAEEANVRKFTGMTADEVTRLNEEFKKMDTRTSREDLNRLAQEAGRLGKTSVEDVLGYVKAADQINVALDDLGDGATLTLSKLTGIFGDEKVYGTEQSLLKVGSVINELSQNCSASAPYLAEFSSRLGGIAAQSKMTVSQIMSFGAVLDTQNMNVEASTTVIGQLITEIYKSPEKMAKAAGLEVDKFTKLVKEDMNGALVMLFEQLNRFGGMENLASVLDEMGTDGARAVPVLSALAGHIEELKWEQEEANKAFEEGISVTNEFMVQNNTVEAQLEKAKKGFNEMAVTLGKQLLPVMSHCISGTSMLMRVMTLLVDFIVKYRGSIMSLTVVIVAYTVALKSSIILSKLKVFWQNKVAAGFYKIRAAMMSNPWGAVAAAVTLLIGVLADLVRAHREESEEQTELNKIKADACSKMADEKTRIELLVAAAKNETLSLEERHKAIDQLNQIIPDYNASLDDTTGKYIENKTALDNYLTSLAKKYELEGARERLAELGKEKAEAKIKINEAQEDLDKAKRFFNRVENQPQINSGAPMGKLAADAVISKRKELLDAVFERDKILEKENAIFEAYGKDLQKAEANQDGGGGEGPNLPKKPKAPQEPKSAQKSETEMDRLKKDLEDIKEEYLELQVDIDTQYYSGEINYSRYVEKKAKLEEDFLEKQIEAHKDHNLVDLKGYESLLSQKVQKKKEADDKERDLNLKTLEQRHKDMEDLIVKDFYDPNGQIYQNEVALNQRLLEEDLSYLADKLECYKQMGLDYSEIQQEMQDRINKDQLEKQKQLAGQVKKIREEYLRDESMQMQAELDILASLLAAGIIKQEEYERAKDAIKEKYSKKDKDRNREIRSDTAEQLNRLLDDYKNLMDCFKDSFTGDWEDILGDIAKLAESAFSIIGGYLSQYSNYANAVRDLEISNIEKHYDEEIKAAGKSEKKKKKIEEQKEAELAKVKNKYNDRAMKIELAQAVAQTAVAAINAYASAAKTNWLLGPVAAAMALAAGGFQIATIKKQHEAQASGYYSGGFTTRDSDNRKEVGAVHANEFVANHEAVANPALSSVFRLIDHAQRNNTVGSLTAADVSRVIGGFPGVGAGGGTDPAPASDAFAGSVALMADLTAATRASLDRLSGTLEEGIESYMVMDGERGFHKRYERYKKLINNPKR